MTVIDEIAAERKRQIEMEGNSLAHDDGHDEGQLAMAAACYAAPDLVYVEDRRVSSINFVDAWPWDYKFDKRKYNGNTVLPNHHMSSDRRREQLVQAAALIVAEIERLDRAEGKTNG